MADGGGARRWLAYGCVGCLGVVGLVVLIAAVTFVAARQSAKSADVADDVITPQLPSVEDPGPDPADGPAEGAVLTTAGTIVLDLEEGGFRIEPAEPGRPLRIEASYDRASHELREALEQTAEGWVYRVEFRRTGPALMTFLKQLAGGVAPEVTIRLPRDVPLALDVRLEQGGGELALGGLWLTRGDVEFSQGGFELEIDEPLRAPMEHLRVRGAMGGFNASGLGNASPRVLDVDVRMGGMNLDLRGAWVADADVSIAVAMGGGQVTVPRGVRVVGIETDRLAAAEDPELPVPTLTFSVSGDPENVEFSRR